MCEEIQVGTRPSHLGTVYLFEEPDIRLVVEH